jgi:membrane glycosyltransferase
MEHNPTDSGWRLTTPALAWRRVLMAVLVVVTATAGITSFARLLAPGGIAPLEWMVLGLFAVTFTTSCMVFWTMSIGILLQLTGRHPVTLDTDPPSASKAPTPARTAIVMPAYNEDMAGVAHCLTATWQSLRGHEERRHFDFFLLSDSTDPERLERERTAVARLRQRFGPALRLYYRARPRNSGRKPGNIRDFCQRWGGHYRYMIVLDADSRMTGEALITLVQRMQANPQAGIIQTVPLPVGQRTVLGRLQQLAAGIHARNIATGLAFWQGNSTNYWGHNAIIRIDDFQRCCGLSPLPGRPPLGGEIMSHDFVEAGLMRRHGRDVYVLPEIGGSFEGMPGNFLDDLKRERRWCQGNLQHLRLLGGRSWRAVTRVNFLLGGLAYVNAPLWLLMIAFGVGDAVASPDTGRWLTAAGTGEGVVAGLVGLSLLVILGPQLIGVFVAAARAAPRRRLSMLRGGLVALGFSILRGPVMMVLYTVFILRMLAGQPAGWDTGIRVHRRITRAQAWQAGWPMTVAGLAITATVAATEPGLLPWLLPALAGPLLYPLLVFASSAIAPAWLPATPAEQRGLVPMNHRPVARHPVATTPAVDPVPLECYRPMPLQPL